MNVPSLCNKIIKIAFGLLFILVPLILTPINYELFEYNKMMVTYALTVIIVGTWIVKMASEKRLSIAKTPLDIPIALFFTSQLLSTLFSMDPHVSWFGFYSRFNGSMWSVISYILLFYAFVSNIEIKGTILVKFIRTSLIVAVVIALYGFAERLGIDNVSLGPGRAISGFLDTRPTKLACRVSHRTVSVLLDVLRGQGNSTCSDNHTAREKGQSHIRDESSDYDHPLSAIHDSIGRFTPVFCRPSLYPFTNRSSCVCSR